MSQQIKFLPNEDRAGSKVFLKCRGCLTEEANMNCLFITFEKDVTLAKVIEESIGYVITIIEKEIFSQHLCKECTRILLDFVRFRRSFREATEYFKNFIPNISENTKDINCKDPNDDGQDAGDFLSVPESKIKCIEEDSVICNGENFDNSAEFCLKDQATQSCQKSKKAKNIQCQLCEELFKSKIQLQRHRKTVHRKAQSMKHPKKSTLKNAKKSSVESIVKINTSLKEVPSSDQSSKKLCKVCKQEFPAEEFEYHLEAHKTHVCNTCGHKFTRKTDLSDHQEIHLDVCKYICQHCGKAFKVRTALYKHKRIHTNPREEICDVCGQRFNTRDTLKTHYKLKHVKSKDFQCNLCGLAFTLKSTLEKHIERHNPNRQRIYSCNLCNVSYINKYNLSRHHIIKHTAFENRPTCELCGKGYIKKIDLVKHVKKNHGQNGDQQRKPKKLERLKFQND